MIDRRALRWNGWGFVHAGFELGRREPEVWRWVADALGRKTLPHRPAVPLEKIELAAPALSEVDLAALGAIVGAGHVKTDRYERAFHSRGKSYLDLLALRAGDLRQAPDAVVYPGSAEEVQAVVSYCDREGVALVPYGGGSSVVGGVTAARRAGQRAVVTLDTTRLGRVLAVDEASLTARVQAGIYGPELERTLARAGYTLGHYPQSFEFSTLGGWIAARGAGQQSYRYGKAEKWLVSAELATPKGLWRTEGFPASAAGPNLNQVVAGSEGILGVITEATVKIHRVPEERDYRGYFFRDLPGGVAAVRQILQAELPVATLRLSDAAETHFLHSFSAVQRPPGALERAAMQALSWRGFGEGRCLLLVGLEGDRETVLEAQVRTRALIERLGGVHLGRRVGEKWYARRFAMPYLRDPMLDRGIAVETLETSARWSDLLHLYRGVHLAIHDALRDNAADSEAKAIVMCHLSHGYADGASLYFTVVFPQKEGAEAEQWLAIKRAATDAIVAGGGTISHHHGVGTDHAPWLAREKGEVGVALMAGLKDSLDPNRTCNPGKVLPE
jgi:alkyldihydroxyacetonephosphate synthase